MAIQDYSKLSGMEKAAIILMSLNENNASEIFNLMDDEEIREVSQVMANLGTVNTDVVEQILHDFSTEVSDMITFVGNVMNTEKLLMRVLSKERVDMIMEDVRGPAGKNTWDKLRNVNEDILANYLKNEYPQTAALILSKIEPAHAARILTVLPEDFSLEVMLRILGMASVKKEILDHVEKTLRAEFISNLTKTQKYDSNELMAEIFNNMDRASESKFMGLLEERVPEEAERVKSLMFTFDDLTKLDANGIQAIIRVVDKSKLTLALKGTSEAIRKLFLDNMSQRAAKILEEDMQALGPVRLKDVDEAQVSIVAVTKDLANKGEITISEGSGNDELIY